MSRLRLKELSSHCLAPVSLSVKSGECVCLSGPSGSGKSTLLRAIADLDPHTGTVFLDNRDCCQMDAPLWRRRVGLLPSDSQWWHGRVRDHFSGIDVNGLQQLGLNPKILDHKIARLSSGERQRLALLRLLANRPQVLLLDEPTASLDTKNIRKVEKLIWTYQKMNRAPVLWVSHDPRQIKRVANRHFRIEQDRLVPVGKP